MLPYIAFMAFAALAAATRRDFPLVWGLFILAALIFVGLRFETGFDWPVYKSEFEMLSRIGPYPSSIDWVARRWAHEIGYVLLAFAGARVLPEYEWFQLGVFAFFLYSVRYLDRSVNDEKPESWALYIIFGFLLFSLIFSTIRQCVALSVFNIGAGMVLRRRNGAGVVMVLLSLALHTSMILYIGIFAAARIKIPNRPTAVIGYSILAAIGANIALFVAARYNLVPKLDYYLSQDRTPNVYEVLFFVLTMLSIFVFSVFGLEPNKDRTSIILVRVCAISAVVALALLSVTTLRNRLFYEVVILAALLIPRYANERLARLALVGLASVFFVAQFYRATAVGFVPYQSFIEYKMTGRSGDGVQRQAEVRRETRIRAND